MSKRRNFNEGEEYCSFRITTILYDVYKKNRAIWEPEFQVRDFTQSPPNESHTNANRFSNDRKQQFMNKNAPHNHAKSNEKYEQRKNVNVNSMQNKQIRNAKMTPVKQSPRSYTPRKLFAHNESMRNTTGSPKSFFF